eukprot:SAG25_NODE_1627_length_2653_cov_1.656226_1_plen_36_part_10
MPICLGNLILVVGVRSEYIGAASLTGLSAVAAHRSL